MGANNFNGPSDHANSESLTNLIDRRRRAAGDIWSLREILRNPTVYPSLHIRSSDGMQAVAFSLEMVDASPFIIKRLDALERELGEVTARIDSAAAAAS